MLLPGAVQAQDFTCATNNGSITITRYSGSGGNVTIPATINGLPVTSIGRNAFDSCSTLNTVTIPDTVTSIGDAAFQYCTSLNNVAIGSGLGDIGTYAFYYCNSLTGVTISAALTNLGAQAFYDCRRLLAITVDQRNPNFTSIDGVLFNKNQTTLLQYPGGKTTNYTVPNTVTNIATGAFSHSYNLTNIAIPPAVTSLGDWAFSVCPNLIQVTLPDSITRIPVDTFNSCSRLTGVTIGRNVRVIERDAFGYCPKLARIAIPSSVTSIADVAFGNCTGLTNVTIGCGLTNIATYAFYNCSNLKGIYCAGNAPDYSDPIFDGATNVTVYYLPGTVGWHPTFAERPTSIWRLPYPVVLDFSPGFGVQNNTFGFRVSWATNLSIILDACTNLSHPMWSPLATNTLTDGWSGFTDPQWSNSPARFYRVRSP